MINQIENVILAPKNQPYHISINGEQGIAGAKGQSAYEVAVENGFIGSEEEWLDSLHADVDDIETEENFLLHYNLSKG